MALTMLMASQEFTLLLVEPLGIYMSSLSLVMINPKLDGLVSDVLVSTSNLYVEHMLY